MEVPQRPGGERARLERERHVAAAERRMKGGRRILLGHLEVARQHAAHALLNAREHVAERPVRHQVIGDQEQEAGVGDGGGRAHGALIGERDRGRMVVAGDQIVDRHDLGAADRAQVPVARVLGDRLGVLRAGEEHERARQRGGERRDVARRDHGRQRELEEAPQIALSPHRQQQPHGLWAAGSRSLSGVVHAAPSAIRQSTITATQQSERQSDGSRGSDGRARCRPPQRRRTR